MKRKYSSQQAQPENQKQVMSNPADANMELPEKVQEMIEYNNELLERLDFHKKCGGSMRAFCAGLTITPPCGKTRISAWDYLKRTKRRHENGEDCFDRRMLNQSSPKLMDGPARFILASKYRFNWSVRTTRDALADYIKRMKKGWKLPSAKQIRTFIKLLPEDLKTYCFKGKQNWWEKFGPCPFSALLPSNELWVADSAALTDLKFVDDNGNVITPWITFIVDAGSRLIIAACLHDRKLNKESILALLREAMLPKTSAKYGYRKDRWRGHNVPLGWLTDNGKPFIAEAVRECCRKLHIKKKYTFPHHPSQNGQAEAFVKYIKQYVVARIQNICFSKNSPYTKGEVSSLWYKFQQQFTLFLEIYNTSPHSVLGGKTPLDYYLENLPVDAFTRATPEEIIKATMMGDWASVQERCTHKRGILFRKHWYNGTKICHLIGRSVRLRFNPCEDPCQEIEVFHRNRFVETVRIADPGCETKIVNAVKESSNSFCNDAHVVREAIKFDSKRLWNASPRRKRKKQTKPVSRTTPAKPKIEQLPFPLLQHDEPAPLNIPETL